MSSQLFVQGAPETSDSPPSPRRKNRAAQQSPLDAVVNQMLKEQPNQADSSYYSENREQRDLSLIQQVQSECESGDTLIIVNFPPDYVDCRWQEWTSKRFYVQSEKLLGTRSKIFTNLLSPERQARFRRRIKLEHAGESLPHKFVIDLTPSTEGDELAAQLMELSLPSGVRDWWMSKERLGISPYLVSGHDDYCRRHNEVPIDCKKTEDYVEHSFGRVELLPEIDLADIQMPESRAIEDYCPIRHRANIIRLILAIEGHDLVLNSAPRLYTIVGVANILDCTSVIGDSVCTWLMAEPNDEFIDINAEAALKIAWTLKLRNVTRAAFRILVVEKTLESLAPEPQAKGSRRTIFGRPREDLPDDLQTVVQYAALKLVDRVQQTLAGLKSDQFYDLAKILEYQKLVRIGKIISAALASIPPPSTKKSASEAETTRFVRLNELSSLFSNLKEKLSEYKDWIVRESLKAMPKIDDQRDFDRDRRCYVSRIDWNPTAVIYSNFSDAQRLLTPCFWEGLSSYPNSYNKPLSPNALLDVLANQFNRAVDETIQYLHPENGSETKPQSLHFNLPELRLQLGVALTELWSKWTRPALETPLTRTKHMVLALSDDEFKYLPLWADGLDDGTGGVFGSAVPDADLGPIGPGPAYHTGDTVATDTSSICQSNKTPSQVSTATLTAGRSLAAVHSNIEPSTTTHDVSVARSESHTMSTSSVIMVDAADALDDDDDDDNMFEFNDSDEISDEAWSQVEER
ncbi:hypothetical protein F4776DRAFT_115826 [Hypoxylon sp. NC0597]|nr:hypothetical protein F4776DRAFT_115826 [Hypoxylon sp. NC0597]